MSSSSENDDYDYCSVAFRLRAVKSQRKESPEPQPPSENPKNGPIEEAPSVKDIEIENCVTRSCSIRLRSQDPKTDDIELISDSEDLRSTISDVEDVIEVSAVTSEVPRILKTPIEILDSPPRIQRPNNSILGGNDSLVDDPTVDIHIRWKSNKIQSIQMEKHESLMTIFQKFADQENIPVNRILVTRQDIPVKSTDTPASLKLSVIDILEGGIISAEMSNNPVNQEDEDDEDICKIKAQVSSKKSVMYKLRKDQPFKKLREHCAKELEVPIEKIKFYFDGDKVEDEDTPDILDLDNEACVDVKILE
ncbi:uncharacterized protein CG4449 [Fopius arisanus]|uniref:Uncharacterized protein CG4449 n=2 Tax=Fopius arisanus TaxID=64838 RepID=A0A9R1UC27_9HYME|nr:PREDICTED: uncharacterized protein CG4449 [Fopius arisanus]